MWNVAECSEEDDHSKYLREYSRRPVCFHNVKMAKLKGSCSDVRYEIAYTLIQRYQNAQKLLKVAVAMPLIHTQGRRPVHVCSLLVPALPNTLRHIVKIIQEQDYETWRLVGVDGVPTASTKRLASLNRCLSRPGLDLAHCWTSSDAAVATAQVGRASRSQTREHSSDCESGEAEPEEGVACLRLGAALIAIVGAVRHAVGFRVVLSTKSAFAHCHLPPPNTGSRLHCYCSYARPTWPPARRHHKTRRAHSARRGRRVGWGGW